MNSTTASGFQTIWSSTAYNRQAPLPLRLQLSNALHQVVAAIERQPQAPLGARAARGLVFSKNVR